MESLVLFAHAPVLGQATSRLAHARGDRDAVVLHAAFLRDLAGLAGAWRDETVAVDPNRRLVVYAAPDAEDPILLDAARRAGARTAVQAEGELGERLSAAFAAEFERGARTVCIVRADSPTLPLHLIDYAFRALVWERVVLGPTFEGGYWLIGAQRPAPALFRDIPSSAPSVSARILAKLAGEGIAPHLLPFWYGVEDGADLDRLVWHLRALRQRHPGTCDATWRALVRVGLVPDEQRSRA